MQTAETDEVRSTPTLLERVWRSSRGVLHQSSAGGDTLAVCAQLSTEEALARMHSATCGLSDEEAERRLRLSGPNRVVHETRHTLIGELANRTLNPLNLLLLVLATASYLLGDPRAAIMIGVMVLLSTSLSFVQEHRSNKAADALRKMVRTTATVVRRNGQDDPTHVDIPIEQIVPGDIVLLSAGDMVPADLRLLSARDLFVKSIGADG